MKPIAVVHHRVNGQLQSSNCYTQAELNDITEFLNGKKGIFVTCLLSLDVIIPRTKLEKVREAI